MKNSAAAPNFAGVSQQELPAPGMFVVPQESAHASLRPRADSQRTPDSAVAAPEALATAARSLDVLDAGAPSSADLPVATDWQARQLERAHDMIALQAVRLRQSGEGTLHVVIKPGAGTQLALDLCMRDGVIEASAHLQGGDLALFQQHWPELQQRLESRGVRLGALSADGGQGDGWQSFSQPRHRAPDSDALAASAFAEWALAGRRNAPANSIVPAGPAYRGWQTWA